MPGRRPTGSAASHEEINNLILGLQSLLPASNQRQATGRSASKILKEVCTHIKKLQKEVDEQSERLSELLSSVDINTVDAATLRSLLQL